MDGLISTSAELQKEVRLSPENGDLFQASGLKGNQQGGHAAALSSGEKERGKR